MNKFFLILTLPALLVVQGCSSIPVKRPSGPYSAIKKVDVAAEAFLKDVDQAIDQARVRDTANFAVHGFPYLRANRFLVGFKEKIQTQEQMAKWIDLMFATDAEARQKEIQNLPYDEIYELAEKYQFDPFRRELSERLQIAREELFAFDREVKSFGKTVKRAVVDPTEYSTLKRAAGLYPIVSLPMLLGAKGAYKEFKAWHRREFSEFEASGKIEIFKPLLPFDQPPSSDQIMRVFRPSRLNALGVPELNDEELLSLVYSIAPIYYQDIVADYDKFGKVVWKEGKVTIDTTKPTVYYYATYNFIKGEPVLQLNYSIWYTSRSGPNAPLIERGELDGMTMRITLDANGWPVMTDFMNSCGCYHFFLPDRDRVATIVDNKINVDPLVVGWQPHNFPKHRLNIKINSGWHQVQRIRAWDQARNTTDYQLLSYDILESLPHEDGRRESVFDDKGIMKNSNRKEDILFFSAGIHKVGYMRQRGQHPTKLVGQAHFTDADIFDSNFTFKD